ncbi:DNA primase large subunit-like [Sycon ciliatum]|uniref:DNA primase large subunit-like n=1 Tax=Sycon ciliatum TaxID=27933 RepID=UPI0031F61651
MEFGAPKTKRARRSARVESAEHVVKKLKDEYPHPLQFYENPPIDNLSLEEFRQFAADRYEVLSRLSNAKASFGREGTKLKDAIKDITTKRLNLSTKSLIKEENAGESATIRIGDAAQDDVQERQAKAMYEERRKDHVSHFILRLAFCRTEELRRWFVDNELELFRYRFEAMMASPSDIAQFLVTAKMSYDEVSEEEKTAHKKELYGSTGSRFEDLTATPFYKVPFVQAFDLVSRRRVFLKGGIAFVPLLDFVSILSNELRTRLQRALMMTARSLPAVEDDSRISPLLKGISQLYTGEDYATPNTNVTGTISLNQLDDLSRKSYAPCMRHLHETLRDRHHLKHQSRMQLGLFVKGIGVTLNDALTFWRSEFVQSARVGPEKFEKGGYAYGIRHYFGKEGKRKSISPYSCMKIITSNAPTGDETHGCPFRHWDPDVTRAKLKRYGVAQSVITEILGLVKDHHYQIACGRYFEATHNVASGTVSINHPNEYFQNSQIRLAELAEALPTTKEP